MIMKTCPLCSCDSEAVEICDSCGFSFDEEQIRDRDKDRIRALFAKIVKSGKWIEAVRLKKRINEIQTEKHGPSSTNSDRGGWSERKTADLLDESNSVTSPDIRLAEALEIYPELLHYSAKGKARNRLEEIKNGHMSPSSHFRSEKELQIFLNNNWDKTPFNEEWELQKTWMLDGRYKTRDIGEIDLLARHRKERRWLVIELKLDQNSDETIGQILRYMGWVKVNLAAVDNSKVEGVIISRTVDDRIKYAMKCTQDITLKLYQYLNDKLVFKNLSGLELDLDTLSTEQLEQLLEKLKNRVQTVAS
ncbi:MAG: hypothetical protein ABSC04_09425 [Syntrophobacteraceae bacterium]